jgi:hypothetical protein
MNYRQFKVGDILIYGKNDYSMKILEIRPTGYWVVDGFNRYESQKEATRGFIDYKTLEFLEVRLDKSMKLKELIDEM